MEQKPEKSISDTCLSYYDFLLIRKRLKGKNVNFNTAYCSYRGVVNEIIDIEKDERVYILIASPESCRRFTLDGWRPLGIKYLYVALSKKKDIIWEIKNKTKIYIAFLNCNNMTIHNTNSTTS